MRIRSRIRSSYRPNSQMAAMIDVVFLLLIFFMLTLKIVEPEGDFQINMKLPGAAGLDAPIADVIVRLIASQEGSLEKILLGTRNLGNDKDGFERLNIEMRKLAHGKMIEEVTIDADYGLNYQYVIEAISACRGKQNSQSGRMVKYFEKIKFAPPRLPAPDV